jgi:phosphatidylserine/phosphatidylglycerophosphate/cardiolipin synthase-like enzyme
MLLTILAVTFVLSGTAKAADLIRLTNVREVTTNMERAHAITLSAYTLSPRGIMARTLLAAAKRGARVRVVLDGHAFGAAQHANLATGLELRQAGAEVTYTQNPLHMKAAIIDEAMYLSDRNWTTRARAETVVADAIPADRPIVSQAITGKAGTNDHLWTRKADALAAEARLLSGGASHDVVMETESFGSGTSVYDALLARRKRGDRVRLIVASLEMRRKNSSEYAAIARLRQAGVEVRVGNSGEKIAVDGARAWLGSANATRGLPDQIDWGMSIPAALADTVRQHFEQNWDTAKPAA